MSSRYSISDYAGALLALFPRGLVWNADPDSKQGKLRTAIAKTFERVDAAASSLLARSLPGDNPDLLEEWERTLGLPDPCIGPDPTIEQRQASVRARFAGTAGGQSRARYIAYAAELGFEITITNFQPFRVGRSTVGMPLYSDAWTFVWGVTIVTNTGGLSPDVLLCEFEAIKPAMTTVILLS